MIRNLNYRFTCLAVEGDWAHFHLMSFEDDEVPRELSFYFDILLEAFDHAVQGSFKSDELGAVAVLSEEAYRAKALASPSAETLTLAHKLRYGYRYPITAAELASWQADPDSLQSLYRLPVIDAGGSGDDCYAVTGPWKERELIKSAHTRVIRVKLLQRSPLPDPEDYGVQAEVRFQVAHADLLAHLVPGTVWNSDLWPMDEEHWLSMGG